MTPPQALPLWLALQPYANARLCLFEMDRPESRSPVSIRRHVIDCFLEQGGIVGGYNDIAFTDPGGIGLLVPPLLGKAIQLVFQDGDSLKLIAERYGTAEQPPAEEHPDDHLNRG